MTAVITGLEAITSRSLRKLQGQRIGLLCNPASVSRNISHARDRVAATYPGQLTALFSPQHGFFAEKQDNMIESDHLVDPRTGTPIFSLYGETRTPTREMLEKIDILLIDLQDAGTRVYTFIYTMSYCMEAARQMSKKVMILDRPNPVGGIRAEGNLLELDQASFVGRFPIPMRHGLTIGELALLFNTTFGIQCDLEVIPMQGWKRAMYFEDTGLPWIAPSPNLPTPASAVVYPGQVIWEGTNISEGRGTTQPFELFGAPFLDQAALLETLPEKALSGVFLRPVTFEPIANKWAGTPCRGFQIHVTDRDRYHPYRLSLALLQAIMRLHPDDFQWKQPPYEYEFNKLPIDLILGDPSVRRRIRAGQPLAQVEEKWQDQLEEFRQRSRDIHLYT